MQSEGFATCLRTKGDPVVRLKMNLVVLILNDSAYGMIKWKQANMGFKNWGLNYKNPDFVKYAESYGAKGHRVNSAEELSVIMKECLNSEGVHLIDTPVDYSENDRILNREIAQKSKPV